MKIKILKIIVFTFLLSSLTTKLWSYPWPVATTNKQHKISGTIGEYRSRAGGAFHAGVDIAESGVSFYAVASGVVTAIDRVGDNSNVSVGYRFCPDCRGKWYPLVG